MGDAIVSIVLEQLYSIMTEEIAQKVRLVTGVEEEIEKLTNNFRAIQAVLRDADHRRMKDERVGHWLDRLKDASYDMDDILDEWKFAIFELQMEGARQNVFVLKKMVSSFFSFLGFHFKQVGLRHDIALRIKEVKQNLDSIVKEKDEYNLVMNTSIDEPQRLKTTSFFDDVSEIRGRDKEKKELVSKLLSDGSEKGKHPHVISIVGMGGIGKTSLAQFAYNNEEVINKFNKRIWVCVSNTFDEIRIVKAIIEGLTGECKCVELQSFLNYIYKLVARKKFLLILDDVWIEEYNWGPLYNCLNNGLHGSKILVTTHKETVSHMMKSFDIIKLGELIEEESWSLFKQLAFFNRPEQECRKLEKIGRDVVRKCKGLPLAVMIVGRLLCSKKTEQQWRRILDNEFWNLEELDKGLFPPLLLSYNDLPLREKRCFSYCAIFPKDYDINKDELIQLWMAQGYLGLEQSEDMETIGQDCFNNLVMHSFIQDLGEDSGIFDLKKWKMHDIVHDFARFLVKNECFAMDINSLEAQSQNSFDVKARHLMLFINHKEASFSSNIYSAQKLRSLLIEDQDYKSSLMESEWLPHEIFEKLTCLRALHLSLKHKVISKEIRKLIHLRYLHISNGEIKEIPETLCGLYNLQTLNLSGCYRLEKLPQGIGKLINLRHLITSNWSQLSLRHLITSNCSELSYMPRGVENLTCLRSLSEFVVGGGSQVCSLGYLQNLNHLRGEIFLRGLGNVGDSAEAQKAKLNSKKNLTCLILRFDGGGDVSASDIEKDGAVLKALQPPLNLETLRIEKYRGTSFPEWMMWLTQLKTLYLDECMECEQLPALGKLPSLEKLIICGMERVKRVGNELLGIENATTSSSSFIAFPKLKLLVFLGMEEWEDWDDEITRQITIMPSLSGLQINACPKLKALPEYILRAISLKDCNFSGCPNLENMEGVGDKNLLCCIL